MATIGYNLGQHAVALFPGYERIKLNQMGHDRQVLDQHYQTMYSFHRLAEAIHTGKTLGPARLHDSFNTEQMQRDLDHIRQKAPDLIPADFTEHLDDYFADNRDKRSFLDGLVQGLMGREKIELHTIQDHMDAAGQRIEDLNTVHEIVAKMLNNDHDGILYIIANTRKQAQS